MSGQYWDSFWRSGANKCDGSTEGPVVLKLLSIQLSNSDFSCVSSSGCPTGAGGDGTLKVAENPSVGGWGGGMSARDSRSFSCLLVGKAASVLLTKISVRWVMGRSHGVVILAFELHWVVVILRSVEHLEGFRRQGDG